MSEQRPAPPTGDAAALFFDRLSGADQENDSGARTCSARGCKAPAAWAVLWNNPKLHPPERRKLWAACDEHREPLSDFLRLRGFLREVEPL